MELIQRPELEIPVINPELQELVAPVIEPLKPGSVVIDGGAAFNLYGKRNNKEGPTTARDFDESLYLAVDGGASNYHTPHIHGWMEGLSNQIQLGLAKRQIKSIKANGEHADYVGGDLQELPFPAKTVNEIFMSQVLLAAGVNAVSMGRIFKESHRVLKDGGRLVVKEYGYTRLNKDPKAELPESLREQELLNALAANGFEWTVITPADNATLVKTLNKIFTTEIDQEYDDSHAVYIIARP